MRTPALVLAVRRRGLWGIRALRMKAARRRVRTIDEALDVAFDGPVALDPLQFRAEIRQLLELVASNPPRTILEIGTARGGSLFLLSCVAARDATLVSIDLPGRYQDGRQLLYRSFASKSQRIEAILGDSHDPTTISAIARLVGEVDLLFLDGDHSSAGVAADFNAYAPLVRPGGLIAFHDIAPGPPELVGGVPDFWREVKARSWDGVWEFVQRWDQGGLGIGVVRVGTPSPTEPELE